MKKVLALVFALGVSFSTSAKSIKVEENSPTASAYVQCWTPHGRQMFSDNVRSATFNSNLLTLITLEGTTLVFSYTTCRVEYFHQ